LNWDRAKSYTILFLALLNVFMGAQLLAGRCEYRLDAARLGDIRAMLAGADIGLGPGASVPLGYGPMRQLTLARYDYDYDALVGLLFSRPADVVRSDEPDETVFRLDDAELSVARDGYITFDDLGGTGLNGALDEASARALCDGYVKKMSKSMQGLRFDGAAYDRDAGGYRVFYTQAYKNTVIYTNFVKFLVTEAGVTQMDCFYGRPLGFSGAGMDICSPDVALLDFVYQITGYYGNQAYDVSISRIDIVYSQEGSSVQDYKSLKATPYYRITFFDGPEERDFLVNAYGADR